MITLYTNTSGACSDFLLLLQMFPFLFFAKLILFWTLCSRHSSPRLFFPDFVSSPVCHVSLLSCQELPLPFSILVRAHSLVAQCSVNRWYSQKCSTVIRHYTIEAFSHKHSLARLYNPLCFYLYSRKKSKHMANLFIVYLLKGFVTFVSHSCGIHTPLLVWSACYFLVTGQS